MKHLFNKTAEIKPALFLSLAVCFLFFIYAPLEIYFGNVKEFSFDCTDILLLMAPTFVIFFVVCLVYFLVVKSCQSVLYRISLGVFFAVFICLYIQGTFLARNLPLLDGEFTSWQPYDYQRIYSIILITIVICITLLLYHFLSQEKLLTFFSNFGAFATAFLIFSLVLSGVLGNGFQNKKNVAASDRYIMDMSTDRNFIILLLDAVDARAFNNVSARHPEYEETFRDFTYYDNTMSCYAFTEHAIPMILTGKWYEQDIPYSDYLDEAFNNSEFLNYLNRSGYELNMYNSLFVDVDGNDERFRNFVDSGALKYPGKFIIMEMELSGLKYFPYDLKKLCHLEPYVIAVDSTRIIDEGNNYSHEVIDVYSTLSADAISFESSKEFKFIYTIGAHVPFKCDGLLNPKKDATYEDVIEASITLANYYLEKLRNSNAYDNSVIVVMADHGYWYEMPNCRQNPILLIKGIGESHDFTVSHVPISHADLQQTFISLEQGYSSEESVIENNHRRYLFNQYNSPFEEFIQTGSAWDSDALIPMSS